MLNILTFNLVISLLGVPEYISVEEFIAKFGDEGIALIKKAEQEYIPSYSINIDGDTLIINGDIMHSMYEDISRYLTENNVKRVFITSNGGDIDAGISIGRLIHQFNLELEVIGYCISSCANYLFTAAANKIIQEGAAVIWHGNSQQKDFREFDQCGRTISSFDGLPMDDEEIAELKTPESQKEWESIRRREHDFYQLIGVNDYITRVGQEPEYYGNFTISVEHMRSFGVTNVQASPNYASDEYCEIFNNSHPDLKLNCISVTEVHLKYESDRKNFGERCDLEGKLIIDLGSN
jgi:hypothetical protein